MSMLVGVPNRKRERCNTCSCMNTSTSNLGKFRPCWIDKYYWTTVINNRVLLAYMHSMRLNLTQLHSAQISCKSKRCGCKQAVVACNYRYIDVFNYQQVFRCWLRFGTGINTCTSLVLVFCIFQLFGVFLVFLVGGWELGVWSTGTFVWSDMF